MPDAHEDFRDASLLPGVPEHQVRLDGGGHPSQTDFRAMFSAPIGVVSVAVEAKAGESFDRLVSVWLAGDKQNERSGKPARLGQLCSILGVDATAAADCRYQLLHRPAAAILEAKRFGLGNALLLVQAFGDNTASFDDYSLWAKMLGVAATRNEIQRAGTRDGVSLWIVWVDADCADASTIERSV